jgi:hypothetical protein
VLYSRRKRQKERADAESVGKSFWTTNFDPKVRMRMLYAAREAAKFDATPLFERARYLILKDEGLPYLQGYGPNFSEAQDFGDYYLACSDEAMPNVIEALYLAMETFGGLGGSSFHINLMESEGFTRDVQQILEEERIAFEFVRGQMVPFESKELHQAVVEPAMRLLHDPRFQAAEKSYQHALEEVTKGKPGDAITDAGTALQEMLTTLGCDGDSLGPLIKSAKAKGLLAAHDVRMTQAIADTMAWVSADRDEKGDSHKADAAAKEDAWFIIHVVGALIVRLVGASAR